MAGLFAANTVAVGSHVLVYVFISHRCFLIFNSGLVQGFVQAEVGHDRGDNLIALEFSPLLHIASIYVEDKVPIH